MIAGVISPTTGEICCVESRTTDDTSWTIVFCLSFGADGSRLGKTSVFSSSENESGVDNGIICAIVVIARFRTTGRGCDNNGVKSGSGRKVELEK